MGPTLTVSGLRIGFPGLGTVLHVPDWSVPGGGAVALEGPSGAGKTSLLHALSGLERPQAGVVRWGETPLWALSAAARDAWRRRTLGLVFQDIHLVDGVSALGNVTLPCLFTSARVTPETRERARSLLRTLGIADADRPVTVMSRGERQRVALARALLGRPAVLVADEPTASLDRASAASIVGHLLDAAAASGATLIVASHDPVLLERVPTRLRLEDCALVPA